MNVIINIKKQGWRIVVYCEIVNPNIANFIQSIRDVGYSFEVAVADIIDNSVAAKAKNIEILCFHNPKPYFAILDDGLGLCLEELIEAMRLASKSPKDIREVADLGRFGLGLKTASFSQCKKLTVASKKDSCISVVRWDLDFIVKENEWKLQVIDSSRLEDNSLVNKLHKLEHGTLVIWEEIDRYYNDFVDVLDLMRKHIALVFHRYLEGGIRQNKVKIMINDNEIKPFNPFNLKNPATQELQPDIIKYMGKDIIVQPIILPHHSKVNESEYKRFATEEGYTKSQGFYLYRENRLLVYGTWWGLNKIKDAHRLVRIKIDIGNDQDEVWGIDIKKSFANPTFEVKQELKRIVRIATDRGVRPYAGRGVVISKDSNVRFWNLLSSKRGIKFAINVNYPILKEIRDGLNNEQLGQLNFYLKGLQSYLPLDAIHAQIQTNPHQIDQKEDITKEELIKIIEGLRKKGLTDDSIDIVMKSELFEEVMGGKDE